MTSVYKNKFFTRFARKARISGADLGGGIIKQRIARRGEGKSGGSCSIILFRKGDRAVYVYGFEKKDLNNIRADDPSFAFKYMYSAKRVDARMLWPTAPPPTEEHRGSSEP